MDYHQNARLTIHSREQLAQRVLRRELSLNWRFKPEFVNPPSTVSLGRW
jgi:hypothetical protein